MKKKILSVLLSFIILLTAMPLTGLTAFAVTNGDFEYEILSETDKTCAIAEYNGAVKNVVIPSEIDGYKVTTIFDGVFSDNKDLISVTMPNTVTNIYNSTFEGCASLESVTLSNSLTIIPWFTFGGCTSLKNVTIPSSITGIGRFAFRDCVSLTEIVIPESVTSIDEGVFCNCTSLTSITIPDNATTIGSRAFANTAYYNNQSNWDNDVLYIGNHLIEAKETLSGEYAIRSGTKTIAECAFSGCSDITEIVFPDGLQVICDGAFEDSSVTKAYFPESLKIIGDNAFFYCRNLKQVKFPKQMEYIGESAFYLTRISGDIIIPDGVKNISTSFHLCHSIKTLTVPASVTDIGILEMQSLTDIFVSENNEHYSSIDGVLFDKNKTMLIKYPHGKTQENYIVPNGVEKICGHAIGDEHNGYGGHEYLRNIVLPESLETIEDKAIILFNLKSVTISANTKSIPQNAILNCDSSLNDLPFTVYGYAGTEAQRYAEAQNYPFIALASYKDKATDIQVYTNEQTDSAFAQNTVLNSSVKETSDTKTVYDIFFTQNGGLIQPNAPVTVKIPVPASMNGAECKVYRQETNGKYTDMNAFYQNGYMVFTTDHFSVYVLTTGNPNGLAGDIDNNGTIDDWDSVLLDRYLAGWDVQVDASVADIDQNGVVDDWDGVLLSRNLAGWKS